MENFLLQTGLGLAGILFTILVMVQDYVIDSAFNKKIFLCKHKMVIIITASIVVLLSAIINISPDSGEVLKSITAMDITTKPHAFLLLAPAIYATVYTKTRANARSRERKMENNNEDDNLPPEERQP